MRIDIDIPALKASIRLSDIVGRAVAWDKRKSNPQRGDFWACCPFHVEKTPSFHCDDRRGRYHCYGCGADGDHVTWGEEFERLKWGDKVETRDRDGKVAKLPAPLAWLQEIAGGRLVSQPDRRAQREAARRMAEARAAEERARQATAIERWEQGVPLIGTIAERYLRETRCISIPPPGAAALRFHPAAPIGYAESSPKLPAMLAAIQDRHGTVFGIQATFLEVAAEGMVRRRTRPPKLTFGTMQDGLVRLARVGGELAIAEGIESALSFQQLTRTKKRPNGIPCWATLGLARLAAVVLPATAELIIAADRGEAGLKQAEIAARRWQMAGRLVTIRPPPEGYGDWNDRLRHLRQRRRR
jgi:hypothetical protein